MSQLNVDTIKKADGTGNLSVPAETGTVVTTASPSLGRRNLIINGAMQVAQRGTSSTLGNNVFVVDRFASVPSGVGGDGVVVTGSQEDDAPSGTALKKSFKATVTTAPTQAYDADDYMLIYQRLEHQDISPFLANGSVTLSFWVKSSTTATYGLSLGAQNTDNTNNVAVYATTYTVNSADTWEKKTITIPVQSDGYTSYTDNALGLEIDWFLEGISGGSRSDMTNNAWNDDAVSRQWTSSASDTGLLDTLNNYWQITGVQLEVGSVATPFEHRSFGEELALCQRYFCKVKHDGTYRNNICLICNHNDVTYYGIYHFPVTMRSAPTGTVLAGTYRAYTGGAATNFSESDVSVNILSPESVRVGLASSAGAVGDTAWIECYISGAGLLFDAEL